VDGVAAVTATRFTRRVHTVDALCFDGTLECAHRIIGWTSGSSCPARLGGAMLVLRTLCGELIVEPGTWVIRGVMGDFYPCDADTFAVNYEPAPESEGGTPD
jgi:hypothetical protein